jgi:hypothetical protein
MIGCKHVKHQQDIADAFNNYFSSIIDKISSNVRNKINYENLSTFHYYVEQNYIHPSSSLVLKPFQPKKLIYNLIAKNKNKKKMLVGIMTFLLKC